MDQQIIENILEQELAERHSFNFPERFHETIDEFLVEPYEAKFLNEETRGFETYWVVADLIPESETEGQLIIYNDVADLFGLAFKGNLYEEGAGILTGFYGSLGDTLENA